MDKLTIVGQYTTEFNKYLDYDMDEADIFCSSGLKVHIEKRHPDCVKYLSLLPQLIKAPDYIGINPNEIGISFELVKVFDNNIQIGIKLDCNNDYMYVATLHTITDAKLKHGIKNGRLKKFDK